MRRSTIIQFAVLIAVILCLLVIGFSIQHRITVAGRGTTSAVAGDPQPGDTVILINPIGADVFVIGRAERLPNGTTAIVQAVDGQTATVTVAGTSMRVPRDVLHVP